LCSLRPPARHRRVGWRPVIERARADLLAAYTAGRRGYERDQPGTRRELARLPSHALTLAHFTSRRSRPRFDVARSAQHWSAPILPTFQFTKAAALLVADYACVGGDGPGSSRMFGERSPRNSRPRASLLLAVIGA